ncbi:hypothetical protein CE91St44_23680 [Oscillospiraceae bacterium]|nr:hypothetical protein CE91St44_23680 [Oscillospiraceae bacterium]
MGRLHRRAKNQKGGLVAIGLLWLAILAALLVLIFTDPFAAACAKGGGAPAPAQQVQGGPPQGRAPAARAVRPAVSFYAAAAAARPPA